MTEYDVVWDGSVQKQIETVTITMEDRRQFTVKRVMACSDALLAPRDTNTAWVYREATDTPKDGQKGKGRPRMTTQQLEHIGALLLVGRKVRSIALQLSLPYSTVQQYVGRRYAARRGKVVAA